MALARWQATIQDDQGNVLPAAQITVRREISGAPLAVLYSDRDGASPIGNPFNADADGFAAFHVAGGSYRIDAVSGSITRTWRYVPIGLAGESDAVTPGISWRFDSATADAAPTAGYMRFNNATLGSVTKLFISETNAQSADLSAWLATWDDGGSTLDRGTVVIQSQSGGSLFVGTITGTVSDDGSYRDISVTPVATLGAFVADEIVNIQFMRAGVDGSGDVSGPGSAGDDNIVTFNGTGGKTIQDSGVDITAIALLTDIVGKQTIWVPASAMVLHSGPVEGEFAAGSTRLPYIALDAGSNEDASFTVAMPKNWNESNVSYQVYWMHPATVTNFGVVFEMFARAYANDEAIDGGSYTSLTTVTDTGGTTSDLYISPESTSTDIANDAEGDLVHFIIRRVGGNGSDTLAVDAYLLGVKLFYTTNAATDA